MSSRFASLLVWALAAFSAVAWTLRIAPRGPQASAQASMPAPEAPRLAVVDVSRMLGNAPPGAASAPAPAPASAPAPSELDRLRLLGVVAAPSGAAPRVAMIAFEGEPPRAWRIGQQVKPGWRLTAVTQRGIELADGAGASRAFELAPLAPAAVGRPGTTVPAAVPMPGMPLPGMPMPGQLPPPQPVPPAQPLSPTQMQMQMQMQMQAPMPQPAPPPMPAGVSALPAEAVDAAHAGVPAPVPLNMEAAAAAAETMLRRR